MSVFNFNYDLPPSMRAGLRAALLQQGIPPAFTDQVADIAVHAADEAMRAWLRVMSAPEFRVAVTAAGPSLSMLEQQTKMLLGALQTLATENGMRTGLMEVKL